MSNSLQSHELQHLRFPCPSLPPRICEGQTHVLLVRDGLFSCCLVISHFQLFCDPMDCSRPGSSVHAISQARMLEWVAISFSPGDLPDPGIKFTSPALQMDSLPLSHLGSPMVYLESSKSLTSFSMYVLVGYTCAYVKLDILNYPYPSRVIYFYCVSFSVIDLICITICVKIIYVLIFDI